MNSSFKMCLTFGPERILYFCNAWVGASRNILTISSQFYLTYLETIQSFSFKFELQSISGILHK